MATTDKYRLSLVAQYDEIVRNRAVLTAGIEAEFIAFVASQEELRKRYVTSENELANLREKVKSLENENMALETKLKHARNQIDVEIGKRKRTEEEREGYEKQILLVQEILRDKNNTTILNDQDREKLAFISMTCKSPMYDHSTRSNSIRVTGGGAKKHRRSKSADLVTMEMMNNNIMTTANNNGMSGVGAGVGALMDGGKTPKTPRDRRNSSPFGILNRCNSQDNCKILCHDACKDLAPLPCMATVNTPKVNKSSPGFLSDYAPSEPPFVPAIVIHCIKEVELRGLKEVGVYRVSGSISDIHVICSCLKDFLRNLKEPLVTYQLWSAFLRAAEKHDRQESITDTYQVMNRLIDIPSDYWFNFLRVQDGDRLSQRLDTLTHTNSTTARDAGNHNDEQLLQKDHELLCPAHSQVGQPLRKWPSIIMCIFVSQSGNSILNHAYSLTSLSS
ncbi:hypothetical protein HELRODRAFT_177894 [Helobdella robusta]|uniref:Rho-GAP domain-containing protein n=1 Tax=Helobdella robusta TaxID=6412 RepID=T1FCF8_HELRO|nr:hypothetical protein HELRODRAFT_177894 [Helobdella robusta]ESN97473.1 hypothetical protein HELRODRAFT_177894 [Helobdella robusta]